MIKGLLRKALSRLRGEIPTDVLIKKGLKVGKNFDRHIGTIIDDSHPWLITIGDNVELAPRVHVLSHDTSTNLITGKTRLGLVNIGDNVFVGSDSVILPNVTIGENVIIGAGSVVSKSIPANSVAVGNPARVICSYQEYSNRKFNEIALSPSFDSSYTINNKRFTNAMRQEMIEKMKQHNGIGYVD